MHAHTHFVLPKESTIDMAKSDFLFLNSDPILEDSLSYVAEIVFVVINTEFVRHEYQETILGVSHKEWNLLIALISRHQIVLFLLHFFYLYIIWVFLF